MKKLGCINAVFILLATWHLRASIGCLDNSWHLQKRYDSKEYHPVKCTCACEKEHKIYHDRNRCSKCMHFHDAKPVMVISKETRPKIDPLLIKKALSNRP
ncbi:MAG TPA: hypothetical protein VLG71_00485 [Candidatus Limnocylindria bacterium]|nr:hypothetical protein [Candidatus Limnocylindria bacterium]